MKNAVLATLADQGYPTSKAATEHGEKLWRKHWPVLSRFEEYDKGRIHNAIHCVALLTDAGEHKSAALVEKLLDWMCEPAKPNKAVRTVAEGMAGSH